LGAPGFLRQIGPVIEQMVGELPPDQLAQKSRRGAVREIAGGAARLDGVPDLAWPDLAPMEERREPRGPGEIGAIAAGGVDGGRFVQEMGQPAGGTGFARLPGLGKTARPIGRRWMQAPILDGIGAEGVLSCCCQPAGRGEAGAGAPLARTARQKGVKTLKGPPLPVWIVQGSCSKAALKLRASRPRAARRALILLSRAMAQGS